MFFSTSLVNPGYNVDLQQTVAKTSAPTDKKIIEVPKKLNNSPESTSEDVVTMEKVNNELIRRLSDAKNSRGSGEFKIITNSPNESPRTSTGSEIRRTSSDLKTRLLSKEAFKLV